MGIGNYAVASNGAVTELAESLTTADVKSLASELAVEGLERWITWQLENDSEIQDYVAATPGQRAKKKRWNDQALRPRLVLGAMTHCQAAAVLLDFLHTHEYELSAGGSYRDTTVLAGSAYWKIRYSEVPNWPDSFARIAKSPFGDD